MPDKLSTLPAGIQDAQGNRATAVVTINDKVRTPAGFVHLISDQVTFSGTPTINGFWLKGNEKILVRGIPVVDEGSVGSAIQTTPSGPVVVKMSVAQGNGGVTSQ